MSQSKTVSYSQLRNWLKCPHYHYRVSITKDIPYPTNKYTVLGTAVHDTCEQIYKFDPDNRETIHQLFWDNLTIEKLENSDELSDGEFGEIDELAKPYLNILPDIREYVSTCYSTKIKSIETELKLEIPINQYLDRHFDRDFEFVGYIDLVLVDEFGNHILIDWKTSTKGWNKWKKADEKYYYQLILYRYLYSKKFDIPLEKVKTSFIIFNARDEGIESFVPPVQEWPEAINSLKLMIYNAYQEEFYPFNKTCRFCECEEWR